MALSKEIKEMKEIFDELEAEVDQNAVNRKSDEIEGKNLLIRNDNLIVDCLSKGVFYVASNSELTVSRFTKMLDAHAIVQARCLELEAELSNFGNNKSLPARDAPDFDSETRSDAYHTLNFKALDFQITQLTEKVLVFRVENAKVKQHYKELYDSIKITCAKHIDQTTALLTENENLKVQINDKLKCVTIDSVKPKVLAPGMYAIDVEPIPPRCKNNREDHLEYLKYLKKSVPTIREIIEEARVERPLDSSLASACLYTKRSQKKQVTFADQCETTKNTQKHVVQQVTQKTNVPVLPSTGVDSCTDASGSKPRSNTKKNRISPTKSVNEKTVEDQSRTNKSNLQKPNHVDSSITSKHTVINSNFDSVCQTFKQIWKPKPVKQVWKATGNVLTAVGYQWKPTGKTFTLGEQCPLTRFTHPKVVRAKQPESVSTSKIVVTKNVNHTSQKLLTRYQRRNKLNKVAPAGIPTPTDAALQFVVVQIILWYLDSGCSKYMTEDHSRLMNFMKKFIGTVRFGNDHFGAIMGYGDYVIGESVISRVYYVEGLGHNLFSMRQFCDSDLDVAFRKHSCYVCDTDGVKIIKGSRGSNLYTISVEDMLKSSPICLLSKASKNKSWLWHCRLNHLNFGTINDLARKDLIHLGQVFKIKGDETPKFVIKFLMQIQVGLSKIVRFIRTDNGTEFVNQVMSEFFEKVSIFHQKSVSRTPQQNGVVERRNRTLMEAAQKMLIFSKARMFLWAEAVATACYTQNRSLIHPRHNKTPYELVHDKKPDLTFLSIFGALCYPTNDSEDL
ncbi:retrovirus-related pol polyprotein from transposon TNT 1-94 [Tanacetum coccineum]